MKQQKTARSRFETLSRTFRRLSAQAFRPFAASTSRTEAGDLASNHFMACMASPYIMYTWP